MTNTIPYDLMKGWEKQKKFHFEKEDKFMAGQPSLKKSNIKHSWEDTPYKMPEGRKSDDGKLRWDLLPWEAVEKIVEILTYGANKYEPNNWQKVGSPRYFAALIRHLVADEKGETLDDESGFLHLAHAACNALFLLWQKIQDQKPTTSKDYQYKEGYTPKEFLNDPRPEKQYGETIPKFQEGGVVSKDFVNKLEGRSWEKEMMQDPKPEWLDEFGIPIDRPRRLRRRMEGNWE